MNRLFQPVTRRSPWIGFPATVVAVVEPPVIVPTPSTLQTESKTVYSEVYNLCKTLPFFSTTLHFDFERTKFPILAIEREPAVLTQRHSCGTREEEYSFYFHSFANTFYEIFDIHKQIKDLFEFKTISVSNRNVLLQDFFREEIIEEEPGIFHGIYVLLFQIERPFSVQNNSTSITYGISVLEAINKKFDLIKRSKLYYNFAEERTQRPYTVIDNYNRVKEWDHTTGRVDIHSFALITIANTFSEIDNIIVEIENTFDYGRFEIAGETFTNCEWQSSYISELEPGIWTGEVNYNILTEKSYG